MLGAMPLLRQLGTAARANISAGTTAAFTYHTVRLASTRGRKPPPRRPPPARKKPRKRVSGSNVGDQVVPSGASGSVTTKRQSSNVDKGEAKADVPHLPATSGLLGHTPGTEAAAAHGSPLHTSFSAQPGVTGHDLDLIEAAHTTVSRRGYERTGAGATELSSYNLYEHESRQMAPIDVARRWATDKRLQSMALNFLREHPVNHLIPQKYVIIRWVKQPSNNTGFRIFCTSDEERMKFGLSSTGEVLPLAKAITIARQLGFDLIRDRVTNGTGAHAGSDVALCKLEHWRSAAVEQMSFVLKDAPVSGLSHTFESYDVRFTGGIREHDIRHKTLAIAKAIYHGRSCRIILQRFGTIDLGMSVLKRVCRRTEQQCDRLGTTYLFGRINAAFNEVAVYIHPTARHADKAATRGQKRVISDDEFDGFGKKALADISEDMEGWAKDLSTKDYNRYHAAVEKGTELALRSGGLTLSRLRRLKLMQAWLPKSNDKLFAARGDVNVNAPFQGKGILNAEKAAGAAPDNMTKHLKGVVALQKRYGMSLSEFHDEGENENLETPIGGMNYVVEGSALEVGELKEGLGIKTNRNKPRHRKAKGFGTYEPLTDSEIR